MKRAALVPLLGLSVAMNLAVAGAWIGHAAFAGRTGGVENEKADLKHPLHSRDDLTAEQRKALEPSVAELNRTAKELNDELARLRACLLDLVASENTDMQALADCKKDIIDAQARLQDLVVSQLLAEKEILTQSQRQELYGKLRDRCGCAGHPGMGVPCGGNTPCGTGAGSGRRPCNCSKGAQR